MAAWLSIYMLANHIAHLLLISFSPSRILTPSPSYTVWCHNAPSCCCSLVLSLPFLYSTVVAPTFPSIPEPSGFSCIIASIALSTSVIISVVMSGFHLMSSLTAFIVSMFSGQTLYLCMRSCSGVGCCLTSLLAVFCIGLCSGCVGGSVARRIAVQCRCLSTSNGKGSRFAITLTMSMAVVLIAPVIIIATLLCIEASLFNTTCFIFLSFVFLPTFCCGVKNTSVAYSILRTAMDR
jgi:hypothetical protein